MESKKKSSSQRQGVSVIALVMMIALTLAVLTPRCYAQYTETILHDFAGTFGDGKWPVAGLIFDASSNLYGTTYGGGVNQNGVVFELSPNNGEWQETTLYSFEGKSDGGSPQSDLVFDAAGNLYGTAVLGGYQSPDCLTNGCGVVYELSPLVGGGWRQTVIHAFRGGADGDAPSSLTIDSTGNLYGVTVYGGIRYGLVYELSPSSSGWQYKPLHAFTDGADGNEPAALTLDVAGNLYVASLYGGKKSATFPDGCGAIIKLSRTASGRWAEALVHEFNGADGGLPDALVLDAAGNLYVSSQYYGAGGVGTVVELSPSGSEWRKTRIYHFRNNDLAGYYPFGLIMDNSENLFGTTSQGGTGDFGGSVYELTPESGGTFTMKVLHDFSSTSDGKNSYSGVTLDFSGNIYGTTPYGGLYYGGIIYELTP